MSGWDRKFDLLSLSVASVSRIHCSCCWDLKQPRNISSHSYHHKNYQFVNLQKLCFCCCCCLIAGNSSVSWAGIVSCQDQKRHFVLWDCDSLCAVFLFFVGGWGGGGGGVRQVELMGRGCAGWEGRHFINYISVVLSMQVIDSVCVLLSCPCCHLCIIYTFEA